MAFRDATPQQLTALAHCRGGEMAHLVELIQHELLNTQGALMKADEPAQLYRLQGKANVLKDLVDAVETSSERLARQSAAKR